MIKVAEEKLNEEDNDHKQYLLENQAEIKELKEKIKRLLKSFLKIEEKSQRRIMIVHI